MKERSPEQLKGQIRNYAREKGLQPQEVLQMFLLERVLERISLSRYASNFILKGGLLISSMFGVKERTTMDIDTTIAGIDLQEETIKRVITEILSIDAGDGIDFGFDRIGFIRADDEYGGFRVHFIAHYGKIANEMKIDISTGDVITPSAIDYQYKTILDGDIITVKAYNKETSIAEKYETIIRRNIGNSRIRDFYDLYMFFNLYRDEIDCDVLKVAVANTSKKRGSEDSIEEWTEICDEMRNDIGLRKAWDNYRENNAFANATSFEDVIDTVGSVGRIIAGGKNVFGGAPHAKNVTSGDTFFKG